MQPLLCLISFMHEVLPITDIGLIACSDESMHACACMHACMTTLARTYTYVGGVAACTYCMQAGRRACCLNL